MKNRFCAAVLCCGLLLLTGCGSSDRNGDSVTFDALYEDAMRQAEEVIANESLTDDETAGEEYWEDEPDEPDAEAGPDPDIVHENDSFRQQAAETTAAPITTAAQETTQTSAAVPASETEAPEPAGTASAAEAAPDTPQENIPVPDPEYEIIGGEAAVTGYARLNAAPAVPLTVPADLSGLPVTAVAKYGFYAADVVLPGTIREIGDYAFNGSALKDFSLVPDTALNIGKHAFADCAALETVRFGERGYVLGDYGFEHSGIVTVTAEGASLTLGDRCFRNLDKLEQVTVQGDLTTGESCFRKCPSLRNVAFSGGALTLGARAFQNTGVREVTFTDCTGTLGAQCFSDCAQLRYVKIGEGITALGDYAFANCRMLRTVQLPAGLTDIAAGCFSECPELTLYAPEGSAAFRFAEKNGIPVKAVG